MGQPIGKVLTFTLTQLELAQTHRYMLFNCPIVDPFIGELRTQTKRWIRSRTWSKAEIIKAINKEVIVWFTHQVSLKFFMVYN